MQNVLQRSLRLILVCGLVVASGGALAQSGSAGGSIGNDSANGNTIISTGHISARSGSGSFCQSDGCTGRWTASKQ